jgi:mitochondrial import receptor subunit TOM70
MKQSRTPRLPSFTFISAYFAAFRPRQFHCFLWMISLAHLISGPLPTLPETPSTGDNTLILALQALEAPDYPHALTLVNEAIEQGISWDEGKAEALNLRGTFKCVRLHRPVNYHSDKPFPFPGSSPVMLTVPKPISTNQ